MEAAAIAALKEGFNALLAKLKAAGLMTADQADPEEVMESTGLDNTDSERT